MTELSDPQVLAFLTEGTKTGHLGYTASDGRPLIAPVWFVIDDNRIAFNTGAGTAKGRAIRRDGRVVMCVDLPEPPYAFVQVQGRVEISEDLDDVRRIAAAAGARYMGPDRAQEFGDRNGVPGELAVWITETKVIASLDTTA